MKYNITITELKGRRKGQWRAYAEARDEQEGRAKDSFSFRMWRSHALSCTALTKEDAQDRIEKMIQEHDEMIRPGEKISYVFDSTSGHVAPGI